MAQKSTAKFICVRLDWKKLTSNQNLNMEEHEWCKIMTGIDDMKNESNIRRKSQCNVIDSLQFTVYTH